MDDAVRNYIDAIADQYRPLFDRIHRLILEMHPDAEIRLSYQMPTYQAGRRRLHLGMCKHGVSFYGWDQDRTVGFLARHPELKTSKGTIQLRPEAAESVTDEKFWDLVRATLDG